MVSQVHVVEDFGHDMWFVKTPKYGPATERERISWNSAEASTQCAAIMHCLCGNSAMCAAPLPCTCMHAWHRAVVGESAVSWV